MQTTGLGEVGRGKKVSEKSLPPNPVAAPGEDSAKSSKAYNSATPWFLPPQKYVVLQPTDWHSPSLVAEMKRRQNEKQTSNQPADFIPRQ